MCVTLLQFSLLHRIPPIVPSFYYRVPRTQRVWQVGGAQALVGLRPVACFAARQLDPGQPCWVQLLDPGSPDPDPRQFWLHSTWVGLLPDSALG